MNSEKPMSLEELRRSVLDEQAEQAQRQTVASQPQAYQQPPAAYIPQASRPALKAEWGEVAYVGITQVTEAPAETASGDNPGGIFQDLLDIDQSPVATNWSERKGHSKRYVVLGSVGLALVGVIVAAKGMSHSSKPTANATAAIYPTVSSVKPTVAAEAEPVFVPAATQCTDGEAFTAVIDQAKPVEVPITWNLTLPDVAGKTFQLPAKPSTGNTVLPSTFYGTAVGSACVTDPKAITKDSSSTPENPVWVVDDSKITVAVDMAPDGGGFTFNENLMSSTIVQTLGPVLTTALAPNVPTYVDAAYVSSLLTSQNDALQKLDTYAFYQKLDADHEQIQSLAENVIKTKLTGQATGQGIKTITFKFINSTPSEAQAYATANGLPTSSSEPDPANATASKTVTIALNGKTPGADTAVDGPLFDFDLQDMTGDIAIASASSNSAATPTTSASAPSSSSSTTSSSVTPTTSVSAPATPTPKAGP